jgi:peroxiredoxin
MHRVRTPSLMVGLLVALVPATDCFSVDRPPALDSWWVLLHEPAVVAELRLTPEQQTSYRNLIDELDLRYFPLRNKSPEDATAGIVQIVSDARTRLKEILQPAQRQRLTGLLMWRAGTSAMFDEEISPRMRLTDTQRTRIQEIQTETASAVAQLEQQANQGKDREPLEKQFVELKTDEQKRILGLLRAEQRTTWKEMHGKTFDVKTLGRAAYKAPSLIDTGEWINSSPVKSDELRGKVVIMHFYAFGCINCIHNFPAYLDWQKRYKDVDVVMIGIHTPETSAERNVESVRSEAAEQKLRFPILVDGKNENWNAWGNSMWPCVYLIDKRGYLRQFWAGELNWQGATGEASMRGWIDELLDEPVE